MLSTVVLRGKPSVVPIIAEWIILGAFFLIIDLVLLPFFKGISILYAGWIALTMLMFLLITLRAIIDLIAREFHTITLTETHLIREHGLFDRNHDMIPLEKVQTAHVRYPLAGQILDYGNLIVSTAGFSVKFRNLPHPQKWESEILRRMRRVS